MQIPPSRADSALVYGGLEFLQGGKIHTSPIKNELFTIIQLPGWSSQLNLAGWRQGLPGGARAVEKRVDAAGEKEPSRPPSAAPGRPGHRGICRLRRRRRRGGG